MRKIFYLFNLFITLQFFPSCDRPKSENLKINLAAEPQTLDPRKVRDFQSQTVVQMCFEGLMRLGVESKPEFGIAEKVDISEDKKIYTFHLRQASWTNGDPVKASDFAYAWKKILDPNFPSDRAFQLYVIKNAKSIKSNVLPIENLGVVVIDEKTLRVELESPAPYFLELTTLPAYFPVNQEVDIQHPHWMENAEGYVCNGPFYLKSWKHADEIEAVKNPLYWDAAHVKLPAVQMVMVSEETEFKMYEKKELDWAGSPLSVLPLNALPSLKQKKEFSSSPFLATYFFRLNTTKKLFQNRDSRKAFALALNRKEIVENILCGDQIPATGLVPRSMGLSDVPYFKDGDVVEACRLFQQAHISPEPVTLLYALGERNHLIAQAVKDQWQSALGVVIHLQPVEKKVFYDRVARLDYDMAIGSWTADFNDPINFLEVFKYKQGSNNTAWENAEYKRLLEVAFHTSDTEERSACLKLSEKVLMDEMPIIPLFHYTLLYLSHPDVKEVVVSPMGNLDFKWAYLERGLR